MRVKHSVLHVVYLHITDEKRKKPLCITNFTCILSENQLHSAECVSSKSVFKNYLSAVHFRCVVGSFGTFLAIYDEFDDKYPKKARVSH